MAWMAATRFVWYVWMGLNLQTIFTEQGHIKRLHEEFSDVTLFCEDGPQIEAHKIICSRM